MSNPPHLSELFKTGQMATLTVANFEDPENPHQVELWFQHPQPIQREEAMTKARAKQSRVKRRLTDPDTDEYAAMRQIVDDSQVQDLVDSLVRWEEQRLHSQAYNEVMYSKEVGSDWGTEGGAYLDLLNAIQDRFEEIRAHNDALSDEDQRLAIDITKDQELHLLQAEQEKFETEVEERTAYLEEIEKAKLLGEPVEVLRDMLVKKMVETESGMAWLTEYRARMLFYAVRYPDDHKRFYFESVEAIWDLPEYLRTQLFQMWDDLDKDLSDLKNSLSPLRS